MNDLISRQAAIDAIENTDWYHQNANKDMVSGANPDEHQAWYKADDVYKALESVPSAQPEEVIPHRNYKYLSDYWCECGWHLGKKGDVKYCSECGRKVNWDE